MHRPSRRPFRKSEAGFTLIELMVVIVIIGLLSTFVVLNVLPAQDTAMVEKAKADVALLEQAVEMYRLDNLDALVKAPADLAEPERYRKDGYVRRLPEDPWGSPYQYVQPGEHGPFDIYSLGANRRLGGEGLDADIGNWDAAKK
jgi:general secretion pathway protein G